MAPAPAAAAAPASPAVAGLDIRAAYGLAGNGVRDDAAGLQRALREQRGPLVLPGGTYLIGTPVSVPSNTTLQLAPDAVLRSAPGPWRYEGVLDVSQVSNVSISGGGFEGGPGGAIYGINVLDSTAVRIRDVRAVNFQPQAFGGGDGIYVGGVQQPSRQVVIENCRLADNVRQGISVTHADGVVIRGCHISGTRSKMPGAGIDLEPNGGQSVRNVEVIDNTLTGNHIGLLVLGEQGGNYLGDVRTIRISGNHLEGNRFLPMVVTRAFNVLSLGNTGL